MPSQLLKLWLAVLLLLIAISLTAQRKYASSSVLANGKWFKIAVKEPGIYKIDAAFLMTMGFNPSGAASAAIRLYGNGGAMLPENCSAVALDDLRENAIEVVDGGDGTFNGNDYILFYANGPDIWLKDSANQRFSHQKNLYSDQSYYYITTGGTGKRIVPAVQPVAADKQVTSFDDRYFHEQDTVNFLNSGKNWFGEEFSTSPGRSLSKSFAVPFTNLQVGQPVTLVSACIARSVNANSRFSITLNGSAAGIAELPGVTASNLELFASSVQTVARLNVTAPIMVSYVYQPGGNGSQGWLDWFEVFAKRTLEMNGSNRLSFRDWASVATGANARFLLQGAQPTTRVWDITDPLSPLTLKTVLIGSELAFLNSSGSLHEYIAFTNTGYLVPQPIGKVANQDLHALSSPDMLIITHAPVMDQARRLAAFHLQKNQLNVSIVTAEQVGNEFGSGAADPTALRDFVKMFYDRAGSDSSRRPRYLLLFGDASFDPKKRLPNNLNAVPAYQSKSSLDPLTTFVSDDYFGFLDDHEDINDPRAGNLLDIGIGRVPVKTAAEAIAFVDKVMAYTAPAGLGPWRNHLTFIADDEDFNLHLHDAETITAAAAAAGPLFLADKIYLDAYQQESNSSGSRYPAVNAALNDVMKNGTLIWNYNGHGGFRRLAEEVVLDQDIVNRWNNTDRLPLFITATCDFAPYDNPSINSLGENILLRPKTGAIALMTTTRLVFAYSNRIMNQNYLLTALQRNAGGRYPSLGEAVRDAKNITYRSQGDIINNLKFTLLGDPAITLAFPTYHVETNTVNGRPVSALPDTLKALQKYTITGTVTDGAGAAISSFNGTVYPTLFDKIQNRTTLGNDPGSLKETFPDQQNILFKGKSDVKNGRFSFEFVVPADIRYPFGAGKINYYAENGVEDANGNYSGVLIGGSAGQSADKSGPEVKAFLNNETFANGALVGPEPILVVQLVDSSGINLSTTGIGHQLTATLDGDTKKVYVLNDFFESAPNSYRAGSIRYQLPALSEGSHTLQVKGWDAANNSSQVTLSFRVIKNKTFRILRVINFPNPFTSKTTFRFDHDLSSQDIRVSVQVFTTSGALVKSIQRTINTGGNRSCDIEWDGNNDHLARLKTGNYYYMLKVTASNGVVEKRSGNLMIF